MTDLRLTLVMPAFNEAATLEQAVRLVRGLPEPVELIVVNDGSVDGTAEIADRLAADGLVDRVIHHATNQGKGTAVRAGFAAATGDVVAVQDADLEYDPHDVLRLMEPIRRGQADAVFGSRFQSGPKRVLYFWHAVGNRLITLLSNMMTNLNLTDVETCYKLVRVDVLRSLPLTSRRFGIEIELPARLARQGARIWEMPITYSGRTYDEGKKINWRDGVAALWHIVRFNLFAPRSTPNA